MKRNSKSVRRSANLNSVNDIVFRGITSIVENQSNRIWVGTMTNLTVALNRVLSQRQRTITPGSPSALRLVINRVANRLRSRGIGVRFARTTDHSRTRLVRFTR
jgi:hypothetical protein